MIPDLPKWCNFQNIFLPVACAIFYWQLDGINSRMGTMETIMGTMETRMGTMETIMGTMETRMGTMETRMGTMETTMVNVQTTMAAHHNEVTDTVDVLNLCTVPVQAGRPFAMVIAHIGAADWLLTAQHNLAELAKADSPRIGNGPVTAGRLHALHKAVPSNLTSIDVWASSPSCDFAVHRLDPSTLEHFTRLGYEPCQVPDKPAALSYVEAVLWSPNQAAKVSTGRVIGYMEVGQCTGSMLVDANIRPGFSGSAIGFQKALIGIAVAEVFEKNVLKRHGNLNGTSEDDDTGNRLYGQVVPLTMLVEFIKQLPNLL